MITDEKLELSKLPIEEQRVIEEIKKQIYFPLLEFDDKEDDENKKHEKKLNRRSSYAITNNHVTHLWFIGKPHNWINLPKNFGDLSQLQCLTIGNYVKKKIPESVKDLKIRDLKIFKNAYSDAYSDANFNLSWIKNYPLERLSLNIKPPEFIGDFYTLKIYNQYNLDDIPHGISNLKNLREFTFLSRYGTDIPNSLSKLSNLRKFHLDMGCIDEIPEWFGEFALLEDLSLGVFYNTAELKSVVGKISTLKKLNLKNMYMDEIPEFIKNLSNLKCLELGYNVRNIPEWFGEFAPLEMLNLNSSWIKNFDVINKITSLRKLIIDSRITTNPLNLDNLDKLESLKIYFPKKDFDFSISDSSSIKELNLAGNKMKNLPDKIKKMTDLEKLNLFSCDLKTLPFWISKLSKLEELNLMSNRLIEIPAAIKNLKLLKKLNLSGNKIKKIPNWIENLHDLKVLDLSFNDIKKTPLCLFNLFNLERLSVGCNQIGFIPDDFKKLINLRYFDFDPEIEEIDRDILATHSIKDLLYGYFPGKLDKYALQYCNDPDSLSDDEKNYLVYNSELLERYILKSNLPSTDPILRRIEHRIKSEIFWDPHSSFCNPFKLSKRTKYQMFKRKLFYLSISMRRFIDRKKEKISI